MATKNLQPVHEVTTSMESKAFLSKIAGLDGDLYQRMSEKLIVEPALNRQLVSFQANKARAGSRWYKYKEAFSASLVDYLLQKYCEGTGKLLDPFAGSGTALFSASDLGMDADGIELLPIGQEVMCARLVIDREFTAEDFATLEAWRNDAVWHRSVEKLNLPVYRITAGAYPLETEAAIEQYMAAYQQENGRVQSLLRFALLCILESISYTRKDGQYLRWDYRSGRQLGAKQFDKGRIASFDQAICDKLREIAVDAHPDSVRLQLFPSRRSQGNIRILGGSCLDILPGLPDASYDVVVTSPPYCNRYDYTRTYALELALLGISEPGLLRLRQEMLSCTVENRAKDLLAINPGWLTAIGVANKQELLQAVLRYLESLRAEGNLNNNGIPRMVRGYFYELACVIAECSRVLKPGARLLMVNDNVRYAGASVSVDLILSDMAGQLGLDTERILVLPQGKGNSSQQMGEHGRDELRKCVYVWRKR